METVMDNSLFLLVFEGILLLPISFIGIFLNTYNIYFLIKSRHGINLSVTFTNLLILLAVFDTLFLVTGIGLFGLPAVSNWYLANLFNKILPNGIGLAYIGRAGSTATTVSISIERHLAIGHPTTITPFKLLFWAPIVFAITYNIPKFFEMAACDVTEVVAENVTTTYLRLYNLTTEKNDMLHEIDMSNSTDASLVNNATIDQEWCDADGMRATSLRQNEWYLIFYVVISKVVLVEVVPWLTVIALNVWTWRKMVVFQRKREAMLKKGKKGSTICQQTKILVGMVVVFIFCQFFPIVGDVYELVCLLTGNNTEGICKSNIHIENCINFGHFMLMVNSSVNFVFYMTNIAKFREGFLQTFCRCFRKCGTPPQSINQTDRTCSRDISKIDGIEENQTERLTMPTSLNMQQIV